MEVFYYSFAPTKSIFKNEINLSLPISTDGKQIYFINGYLQVRQQNDLVVQTLLDPLSTTLIAKKANRNITIYLNIFNTLYNLSDNNKITVIFGLGT